MTTDATWHKKDNKLVKDLILTFLHSSKDARYLKINEWLQCDQFFACRADWFVCSIFMINRSNVGVVLIQYSPSCRGQYTVWPQSRTHFPACGMRTRHHRPATIYLQCRRPAMKMHFTACCLADCWDAFSEVVVAEVVLLAVLSRSD